MCKYYGMIGFESDSYFNNQYLIYYYSRQVPNLLLRCECVRILPHELFEWDSYFNTHIIQGLVTFKLLLLAINHLIATTTTYRSRISITIRMRVKEYGRQVMGTIRQKKLEQFVSYGCCYDACMHVAMMHACMLMCCHQPYAKGCNMHACIIATAV